MRNTEWYSGLAPARLPDYGSASYSFAYLLCFWLPYSGDGDTAGGGVGAGGGGLLLVYAWLGRRSFVCLFSGGFFVSSFLLFPAASFSLSDGGRR